MLDKLDKMWYNIEVRLKVIKNIILNCCLGQKVKTYINCVENFEVYE